MRSSEVRSPMCCRFQASREVCSLPPMARTMTSAFFATSTASAIWRRSSSGSLGTTAVLVPGAADGDLAAFAVEHLRAARRLSALMPSSTVTLCFGTPLYPPSRPRLALGPMTAIVLMCSRSSGARLLSFLRSVIDSCAASRASSRCSLLPTTRSASSGSTYGSSKSPISNFQKAWARRAHRAALFEHAFLHQLHQMQIAVRIGQFDVDARLRPPGGTLPSCPSPRSGRAYRGGSPAPRSRSSRRRRSL